MILRTVNGRPVEELYALIRANIAGTSSERAFAVLQRRVPEGTGVVPDQTVALTIEDL
jgi:hypothetical protein